MSNAKPPKPESLEAKFKLMTLLPYDRRARRKHCLVFGFILDWYHSRYGDALASVRHIVATIKERDPAGIGLYTGDVHSALSDLVSWGYLTQQKGSGRKASRYVPVWSKTDSVLKTPNATDDLSSVLETPNADVRETPNATADSVHKTQNEDPSTGPGHRTGSHVVGNEFDAAPMAPHADGLEATAAGSASGDRFKDFWKAWPRKHGIKKAKAEWKKIESDADLVSHIIVAARTWAAHYEQHGVDRKWIPEPANWLAGERWDEDLPLIHIDAKGAAIAKSKANAPAKKPEPTPANDNDSDEDDIPEFMKGSPSLWPIGEYHGEFIENDVVNEYDGKDVAADLIFHVKTPGAHFGKKLQHKFYVQSFIQSAQSEGQKYLADICAAVGLPSVEDLDDLMFQPVMVKADGRRLVYSKIEREAA